MGVVGKCDGGMLELGREGEPLCFGRGLFIPHQKRKGSSFSATYHDIHRLDRIMRSDRESCWLTVTQRRESQSAREK